MPIQLIDNFELNVQKPIDNRFVVGGTSSFYATRFDIVNAYHGLRIWDLNDGQPYVYDGSTWSSEATLTTIQGNGTANYLPKFNTSNSIEDSIIYQNSGNIIIGTTSIGSPSAKLVVDGNIKANSGYYYYGSGLYLTALNATEITTGTLDLARLSISSSSSGWIMSRNSSSANWVNPNSLAVATASALETTRTLWGQNFNGTSNVSGNITVNGGVLAITGAVQFKNSNNGFLNVVYGGASNINRTYTIPGSNGNRTFALLEHSQTFTAAQAISESLTITSNSSNNNVLTNGLRFNSTNDTYESEIRAYQGSSNSRLGLSFRTTDNSTTASERMRLNPDGGIQMMNNTLVNEGSFTISVPIPSTTTDGSYQNVINIASADHDRIIYFSRNDDSGAGIIQGSMVIEVLIGVNLIYHTVLAYDATGGIQGRKIAANAAYSFVLPSGLSSTVRYRRIAFQTNGTLSYSAKSLRFGK